jgi:DNA mismatch repair protein MSH2
VIHLESRARRSGNRDGDDVRARAFESRVWLSRALDVLSRAMARLSPRSLTRHRVATCLVVLVSQTTSVIRYLRSGDETLPGVTLNRAMFELALRELLLEGSGANVEVYEETKPAGTWRCVKTASPGKLGAFEDELFRSTDMSDAAVVCAARVVVKAEQRHVGVAYVNATTRELGACEFVDDEQFCTLESVLCQIGAKECVMPKEGADGPDGRRLKDVVARCGALATERAGREFDVNDLESDLGRLVSGNVEAHRAVIDKPQAASCLAAVLRFSEMLADSTNHGRCALSMYDTGRYMRLDSSALRALNVLPERADGPSNFSLYGLLNKCRTPMGRRLLLRWLKQPLVNVDEIATRHDVVSELVSNAEVRDALRSAHLRSLPDIERIVRKLERRKASLMDLCRLYQASAALPHMAEALERCEGRHADYIRTKYADQFKKFNDENHLGRFEALLEAAVDLAKIPDEYVICASYDAGLGELQQQKDALESDIRDAFKDASDDLGMERDKQLKLEHNNMHGWFMRLTKKDETSVRKKLSVSYQILEAKKDGTKFTNKTLRALSEQRMSLDRSYEAKQRYLVDRVVDVSATFSEVFFSVSSLAAELDVLTSFAEVSVSAPVPFIRPIMHDKSSDTIHLENSRHPNVEAQDNVRFIANTCSMKRGESWFQIITGPNMGGKSTFIRQVGVCVLLAQIGCFVPCDEATISVRDAIFARVGAGDCQLRGISTFMAEMLETAAILKAATPASLVIIDELGRGTSTYDGFGLAWAISEHIVNEIKAPCLFATHFHELTALQGPSGVANFHVEALIDQESRKLTMLYQIKPGACDQSFGIHCAEFARFPEEVLKIARAKAEELEDFSKQGAERATANIDANDDSTAKRQRTDSGDISDDMARGVVRARQFLSDFAAVPLDQMEPVDAVARARQLKAELDEDARASPWLTDLVSNAA